MQGWREEKSRLGRDSVTKVGKATFTSNGAISYSSDNKTQVICSRFLGSTKTLGKCITSDCESN